MRTRTHNAALFGCLMLPIVATGQTTLERVVVTGSRTPVELQDFAGGINRIDNEDIELTAATSHTELLNRVPGTYFQRNSGQESLTAIRSPVLSGPGSCGSFLFMEDSIPIRPVGFCNVNELFEVNMAQAQAVEVLRGPAGALYGSSAMHGAVNVLSMDPTRVPKLSLNLEGGEDSFGRGAAVWSMGDENNALALATIVTHDGGWRDDNKVNEQKANAAWHLGLAASSLDVRFAYSRLDQDTAGFIQGFEAYKDEAIARSNANPEAYRNAHAARLNADWEKPLTEATTLNLRPYARTSRMEFLQHFLPGKPLEENGQDSFGLLSSVTQQVGDDYEWSVGVDLELADSTLSEVQAEPTTGIPAVPAASRPVGKHYDYEVQSSVAAIYFRDAWELGLVRLVTGLRGEYVKFEYDNLMLDGNTRDDGTPCPLNPTGCLYFRPADRNDTFRTVTPQIGATLRWAPEHSLYFTATSGYRAPETTELYRIQRQQSTDTPREERLEAIELGMRGHAGMFDYDFTAFAMRKEHLILRDANGLNLSDGRTKHHGVEYSLLFTPIEQLNFAFVGTHAKHLYDFTATVAGGEAIVAGRTVDTAPRNTWTGRIQVKPTASITTEIEWQHVGAHWVDAANENGYEGHDVLNLRAGWSFLDNWRVGARLINVLDEEYADRADFAQGNYRYFPGRPRTFFVEVGYRME